ncbi:MAG: hypothetical protein HXY40_11270 [Chloroflexi bacterium]|nr:hypothetical protein [Chloroflexota bacterium]
MIAKFCLLLCLLAACAPPPPASAPQTAAAQAGASEGAPTLAATTEILPAPTFSPTPPNYPWTDENAVVSGLCFAAAQQMAQQNQRFVLRSAQEHSDFYDAMDSADLCLRPVARAPFDFSGGRALAGLWSAGRGCTARHEVLAYGLDGSTLNITLHFLTQGNCDYELVRPFWIGFDGRLALNLTIAGG